MSKRSCTEAELNENENKYTTLTNKLKEIEEENKKLKLSKAEIIKKGQQLGIDYQITSSCYSPNKYGQPCGQCDACKLRIKGFYDAGLADPLNYE